MGSATRRHQASTSGELSMRNVQPIDATFLKTDCHGTSYNIIQIMADSEITLETITADAENESKNTWIFGFKSDGNSVGSCKTNPQLVFVCDRMKGQNKTFSWWFSDVGKDNCLFHLKENMGETKNGGATPNELSLFNRFVYLGTIPDAYENKINFLTSVRPKVANCTNTSIFNGNCSLDRFCDAFIMKYSIIKREREKIFVLLIPQKVFIIPT